MAGKVQSSGEKRTLYFLNLIAQIRDPWLRSFFMPMSKNETALRMVYVDAAMDSLVIQILKLEKELEDSRVNLARAAHESAL